MNAMKGIPTTARTIGAAILIGLLTLATIAAPGSPGDIKLGKSCVSAECHGDIKGSEFLHGPVNLMQCEPCHVPIQGRHEFTPVAKGQALCQTCHEVEAPKSVVHAPFAADCTACHDPHGADNRHLMKGGDGADACMSCHDSVTKDMTHLHGPVAAGECLACHSPHQSDNKGLLVEPRAQLCLGCHIDVQHDMEKAVSIHQPVKEACAGCHDPHGGTNKFFHPATGADLCKSCHADFLNEAATAKFPHSPMTADKECQACHAPHASSQAGLLGSDTKTLCLGCHDKEVHGAGGEIYNVAERLQDATFVHGPIRDNNCVACHKAHGSEFAAILTKSFPDGFYAPYEKGAYDLCFECHDRTVIEDPKTATTGFRDGNRNLHFLHVNREKGRTCRACHDEHAAVQDKNIRSEVPFGRWMMKVQFTPTETGGTCETGCHVPYTYDRLKPAEAGAAQ